MPKKPNLPDYGAEVDFDTPFAPRSDKVEIGFWPCQALNDAPREARRELSKLLKARVYRASYLIYDRTRGGVVLIKQRHWFK